MKKLAPLLLVLLAASLWSWTQRAQAPLMLPSRATCAVDGIHLGDSPTLVQQIVGKPNARHDYGLGPVWIWRAGKLFADRAVAFKEGKVARVVGSGLTVGSKDYEIVAGMDASATYFLNNFATSSNVHDDAPPNGLRTWHFPEVDLEITYNHQKQIDLAGLSQPSRH